MGRMLFPPSTSNQECNCCIHWPKLKWKKKKRQYGIKSITHTLESKLKNESEMSPESCSSCNYWVSVYITVCEQNAYFLPTLLHYTVILLQPFSLSWSYINSWFSMSEIQEQQVWFGCIEVIPSLNYSPIIISNFWYKQINVVSSHIMHNYQHGMEWNCAVKFLKIWVWVQPFPLQFHRGKGDSSLPRCFSAWREKLQPSWILGASAKHLRSWSITTQAWGYGVCITWHVCLHLLGSTMQRNKQT